ncbi:MAG: hypothetical protein V4440_12495 [Pseudomonadota bacterium]
MPLINRDNDVSEAKQSLTVSAANVVNNQDIPVALIERACTVTDCKATLLGISGAPTLNLKALRFIAGTGGSSFVLGTTFAITAFGTSGYISYSLVASGGTVLNLQKGDLLVAVQGGGTGAGTTATLIDVIVQNIQDIKTWY